MQTLGLQWLSARHAWVQTTSLSLSFLKFASELTDCFFYSRHFSAARMWSAFTNFSTSTVTDSATYREWRSSTDALIWGQLGMSWGAAQLKEKLTYFRRTFSLPFLKRKNLDSRENKSKDWESSGTSRDPFPWTRRFFWFQFTGVPGAAWRMSLKAEECTDIIV